MSDFGRKLDRLDLLSKQSELPLWWQDMLELWRPSGYAAGDYGLRLAIRNGYLNFYRRGQSVAKVEVGKDGMPFAYTHLKYVAHGEAGNGQEYVTLKGNSIIRNGQLFREYGASEELKSWIETIDSRYANVEKSLVDEVVAANPGVIDLEMGLPAWGDQTSVPRMDLVDIEVSDKGPTVVFWEAKCMSDGRLKVSEQTLKDKPGTEPEVMKQLEKYHLFLKEPERRDLVAVAYRQTAQILRQLHSMVPATTREKYQLGAVIANEGAMEKPEVAPRARLLVFKENRLIEDHWKKHQTRLEANESSKLLQIIPEDGPYVLERLG